MLRDVVGRGGVVGWVDTPKVCGVFTMGRVRKGKSM